MEKGYWIFIVVITLLLVSWSLVTFWQRFLENLMYNTLGFDPDSTSTALFIAIGVTGSFFLLIWIIKITILPHVDSILVDYPDESTIGGPLQALQRREPRVRTIGRRTSPRGALPTIIQN